MKLASIAITLVALFLVTLAFVRPLVGANNPPVASFTYSPDIPAPEELITFDASASYDPDGTIVQYSWDFGDGTIVTIATSIVTHSYPVDGNYTVELTVTDNNGATENAAAVVQVQTVVFFRVVSLGTLSPLPNAEVTVYYNNGTAWVKAPTSPSGLEIKYDNMTQPDLANSNAERYRNPGFTASILRSNASNIGFDIHPAGWTVFFRFQWGPYVAYWPNDTTRVYTYYKGSIIAHDYAECHRAWWDPTASTYVIRAGDIPGAGVSPTSYNPIIFGLQCLPPPVKYYLTVRTAPSGITSIPGEGWYTNGSDPVLTAPDYVNVSAGTRYTFSYWDVDGASRGVGVNPITVHMDANHTATAHYVVQYSVIFGQTGLGSDATGTIVTVNGSSRTYGDLPYTLWVDSGSSVTYSFTSPVSSSVSGKRFRLDSVSGPASPISVTGPVNVTGNYVVQYLVTFAQSGLDSTATGTVVVVNGSAKSYGNLPYDWWVDSGSTVTYSYSSTVSSSVSGKQFRLTSVNCPPSQFIVTGPTTVTGFYCVQYQVTFSQTGLDSTASGAVVTVNGTSRTYGQLPYSLWVDSGSGLTYSYTSPVPTSYSDKRFRLNSVTGPTSPFTVTGPTNVTGNYVIQYLLTFTHTGLDSTATGTVVTVNGSARTFGELPSTLWADSGSSVTYSYASPVSSSLSDKQFRLSSVSGPASPITVGGSVTVTGNYVIQYRVTFAQTGLDSNATGTIVTVNGTAKAFGDLPYSLWVDSGSGLTYSYTSPVPSSVSGKQFRLGTVSGPASPIAVTNSVTVTGNYIVQFQATFAQSGLDSTATGTVVTVNGSLKEMGDLPFNIWVDSGSSVTYYCNDVVLSTTTGKQFKLTSISGPASPVSVTAPVTVTGSYRIQYQVAFDQTGVGSDFTGTIVTIDSNAYGFAGLPVSFWLDKDSVHNFSFATPLTVNASMQYAWSSTSGLTSARNGTLTVTVSGSVVGNYVVQNCVTFDQLGVSPDFNGTVLTVDNVPYGVNALPVSFTWQIGSVHNFSFQSPLVVTENAKRYVWTNTTGLSNLQSDSLTVASFGSVVGSYKTQCYLNVPSNPPGITSPSGSGWYDYGSFASISTEQYVPGGSRWRFAGWTTADMSEIADPSSPSTTVLIDKAKTVYANYIHQYLVTFAQTGLTSDASGTVVTINGTSKSYGELPNATWADEGSTLTYSYETTISSTVSGKRFRLSSVSGPSSPITVSADTNVTGNYVVQYCLTVSSPYGTTSGQGWYDSGATAYAGLNTSVVDHGNRTQHVFMSWGGDASGTNYVQSDSITMDGSKLATAGWKTQYNVTFAQSGLDSSAASTVVTVDGVPKAFGDLAYTIWVDDGAAVTYSYSNVSSSTAGKRFILTGVSGPGSPATVTEPLTFTGSYKTQYQVTFSQTGVSSDFGGTIVTVDGTGYSLTTLPQASFWWDAGSLHPFLFSSPLVVNAGKQYVWSSTTGLSSLQGETLTVTGSGNVTGNYVVESKYQITFSQKGVGGDFTGNVVFIDGVGYKVGDLNASFWWDAGSVHTFDYQSPLVVTPNVKRYIWVNTTGLSTLRNGSITVSASGSITGNYKTQYYLTLNTNPLGVTSPSGEGWYDVNTYATISTAAFVDIVPGSSRYRFNGWTTPDMSEIANPTASPTTVYVDKGKTVTANYATQYKVTFGWTGVNADFPGTILTVDGRDYNFTNPANPFWWDASSVHTFSYHSPLVVTPNAKRYVWTNTTGVSDQQSGSMTVSASGSVTGNYRTQYYLIISSSYNVPIGQDWYDSGTIVYAGLNVGIVDHGNRTRHVFTGWSGDASGANYAQSSPIFMDGPKNVVANWKTQYYLTVRVSPSVTSILGEDWYDVLADVPLTAPLVSDYKFIEWRVDGASQGSGVDVIDVLMNSPHEATAYYQLLEPGTAAVGGHSFSLAQSASPLQVATYLALVGLFGAALGLRKRKRK